MIKHTVEVSGPDTALALRRAQVEVTRDGLLLGTFPAEDVGVLIVDTPNAHYTHGCLVKLLEQGAAVVLCGEKHLPAGVVLPVAANSLQAKRLQAQAAAPKPLLKRLWRQIVRAKIAHQAELLEKCGRAEHTALRAMLPRVRSGDPGNVEAQAARVYWPALLGPQFRRVREGLPPNGLLNYGYMALRAAVARALCGAGLHPSLGLHHSNQYNAFALADDLFEPLRPVVDRAVRKLAAEGCLEVDQRAKPVLLGLLAGEAFSAAGGGPLQVALERYCASLAQCYCGEVKCLEIPKPWN